MKKNPKVILLDNYKNTEYLSKNIVNFPNWTSQIVNELYKKKEKNDK